MRFLCLICMFIVSWGCYASESEALPAGVYAQVAGENITTEQYHAYYAERMRQEFYHGKVPETELKDFDKTVLQELVDRVLLRKEARRRSLTVDEGKIKQSVEERFAQFGHDEVPTELIKLAFQEQYDNALSRILREAVDAEAKITSDQELLAYYEDNANKFTRPEQLRISLILLKVAPYEQAVVWQAAYDELSGLLESLETGENFRVLARKHSDHESAQQGGDLGFVHTGMLSSEVQEIINGLPVGGVVEKPVVLLQGVAILRLDERKAPVLLEFEQAKERATALLIKEKREQGWEDLLVRLREKTPVILGAR